MAKRKFRIEGGRYGGEFVCGEVNENFVRHFADKDTSNLINTFEAYLEEHLDGDWDEGFDYGDDEEQET